MCFSLDEMMYDRIVFITNFSALKFLPFHIICLLFSLCLMLCVLMRILLLGGMPFEKTCTSKAKTGWYLKRNGGRHDVYTDGIHTEIIP